MKKIDIRVATTGDIQILRAFEQKLIVIERDFDSEIKSGETTYYDIENLISDNDSFLVVAETSGEIVGSGYGQIRDAKSCFKNSKHCYLGFIFVEDSCRGLGIAKRIIDTICSWSEERGISYFLLDVYSENKTAIRAYEKLGFKSLSITMELKR